MNMLMVVFSAGRHFYAVPDVKRECGLWLSVEKHELPIPPEWHRPGSVCACVMRGRCYYRIGIFGPQHADGSKAISIEDELVKDYRDAAWWTPSLEEAWLEILGMREAFSEGTKLHVCTNAVAPASLPVNDVQASALVPPPKSKGGKRG
jgi:hypothetical protein